MKLAEIDTTRVAEVLENLEIEPVNSGVCGGEWIASPSGAELESINPADGSVIAKVQLAGPREYDQVITKAQSAFHGWRRTPAPTRGEIVQDNRNPLRRHKSALRAPVESEIAYTLLA